MLRGAQVSTQDLVRLRGRTQGLILPNNPAVYRTGGYRSQILGRGMDYEKSRKYEAGDDVRMIDWRVTARTGTAHTKIFQEDRQKAVYLIVDFTSSMRFGTQVAFKSVVAAEAAAAIAWSAHSQGDLISVIGVCDDGVRHNKLASSSEALIKQLDMLAKLNSNDRAGEQQTTFALADALSFVVKKLRTGDLAVVLSDFQDQSQRCNKALEYLSHRQSLILVWVQDSIEQQALPAGHFPITDGLQYATLHLTSPGRRKKLQKLLDRRNQTIEEMHKRLGTIRVKLTCGDDVIKTLHRAFHRRAVFHSQFVRSGSGGVNRSSIRTFSAQGSRT